MAIVKTGFIALEGIDGCGKSSVATLIAESLGKNGIEVSPTQEPTKTWLGDAVRRSYKEEISPYTEAFLFLADRATHTAWIRKELDNGKIVISDRYSDSTIAYQAALLSQKLGGHSEEYIDYLTKISKPVIIEPDLTLLFDIDPHISLGRLNNRAELEKFESLENLHMVRQNYLQIAKGKANVRIIDATPSLENVGARAIDIVRKHFAIA